MNLNPQQWVRGMQRSAKNWLVGQLARYILGLILSFVLIYVLLIDQSITGFLNTFGFIIAINLMVSGLIQLPTNEKNKKKVQKLKLKKPQFSLVQSGLGLLLFVGLIGMNVIYPLTVTQELSELGEIEVTTDQIESVTEESVRSVPYSYARYKSEIVFGNIDNYSFYELGETSIQKINDELFLGISH